MPEAERSRQSCTDKILIDGQADKDVDRNKRRQTDGDKFCTENLNWI